MKPPRALFFAAASLLLTSGAVLSQGNKPIAGIVADVTIVKLHTGFTFTEGPAADAKGNVYFTDVRANRIHKVDTDGRLATFLEDSKGCNGLMFDGRGRLIACQGGEGRIIAIDVATKNIEVLADHYNGKRFNAPNDLAVDRLGGVYFTDPGFRPAEMTQDKEGVYYISKDRQVTRVLDNLPRPNGVLLSPDDKTLYVVPSGSPEVRAYPVEGPGKPGAGQPLCPLEQLPAGQPRGGDGLTVDTKGNLYLALPALSAIQIVSAKGTMLGLIKFPEAPANCAFGGKDMKTLFVTARTSLYALKMNTTGHRIAGGQP